MLVRQLSQKAALLTSTAPFLTTWASVKPSEPTAKRQCAKAGFWQMDMAGSIQISLDGEWQKMPFRNLNSSA